MGQFAVGGSKCALREHSEGPGGAGIGLSLRALAGAKLVRAAWDIVTPPIPRVPQES